jgi:hypothetical protein
MLTGIDPIDDLLKPPSRVVILNVNVSRETCVKHVYEMCKVQGEKFNHFPFGPSCPICSTGWSDCSCTFTAVLPFFFVMPEDYGQWTRR